MAGIDGVTTKKSPGDPLDEDIYEMPAHELAKIPSMPGSLEEALAELEADHAFLLQGDVFTRDVIETQLGYKRKNEIDALRLRPHPYEFELYFDA
jgi:glutamine synthetase